MNANQWQVFCRFRQDFKNQCEIWQSQFATELAPLQKNAALTDTPDYPIENPVVYNTALDNITQTDDIRLIVIGDNPGKAEQLSCNKQYLVGQSGKIAQSTWICDRLRRIHYADRTISQPCSGILQCFVVPFFPYRTQDQG